MSTAEKLGMTQQLDSNSRAGEVSRLGYSGLFYADGSEGVRGWPYASAYDQANNAAASFDRDLMYRRAAAIGAEARGKGINTQFGPGVNLLRLPEGGRGFECEWHLCWGFSDKETSVRTHTWPDRPPCSM